MRTLLIISSLLLISFFSNAQLKVSKVDQGETVGKVKRTLTKIFESVRYDDDRVVIYYRDYNYQTIAEYKSFSLTVQSFNELYDLISNNMFKPPKDDFIIETQDGGQIILKFTENLKGKCLRFIHYPYEDMSVSGRSMCLNVKEIKKLFGK